MDSLDSHEPIQIVEYNTEQEILDDLVSAEDKYDIESCEDDASVINKILEIYGIHSNADMVPDKIYGKYTGDWNKLVNMVKFYFVLKGQEQDHAVKDRFSKLLQAIESCRNIVVNYAKIKHKMAYPEVKTIEESFLWKNPIDVIENLKPLKKIELYVLHALFDNRYRRSGNSVMEQIFTPSGLPTHAWKDRCTITSMIQKTCNKEDHMDMWNDLSNSGLDDVAKYLTRCSDAEFPDLVVKNRFWAFSDGTYNADNDQFTPYGAPVPREMVACKIIDLPFAPIYYNGVHVQSTPRLTFDEIKTPLFDSIFAPQEWDDDMMKWMFVFIGRLFYKVNEKDTWQVIPFLKGVAGTGKSTVIKIVQMFYDARDVGVISNNIEKKFGLSTLFDKIVFVIPELKRDFQMDQADFQSIVTGEEVSMAVKHENPIIGQWTVPGIIAGNETAGWADKSGSISRRIVVLDFPNKIDPNKIIPDLLQQIKESELAAIIRKASLAYTWAVDTFGKKDIWTSLPPRVCKERKKLQFSTDSLYAFLNSDEVDIDQSEYVPESIFISKLKNFAALRFHSQLLPIMKTTIDIFLTIMVLKWMYVRRTGPGILKMCKNSVIL